MIRHFSWARRSEAVSGPGAAGILLGLALFLAPLPFGSVTRGFELGLHLAGLLALALVLLTEKDLRPLNRIRGPALALAALALFGVLQSLPWPRSLVAIVSPHHAELAREGSAVLGETAAPALSLAPGASRSTALELAVLTAALAAAAYVGRRSLRRRWLAGACIAAGLFEAVYGARRWYVGSNSIWGVEVPGSGVRLRGTFVNPDHLATYLEIVLAVVFAWGWWAMRRARRYREPEIRLLLAVPPVVVWLALFATLAFTGSRAGLLAALLATALQGALIAIGQGRLRLVGVGGGVAALGIGVVAWLGAQQGFGRLLATSAYEVTWGVRAIAYRACLELWQRFPVFGTGLGTFRESFPLVQAEELYGEWHHAHSGPLEVAVTTGGVGLLLAGLGILALARQLLLGLRRGWRSEEKAACLAALGALAAALAHECVDFGLVLPANSFTLVVLCGAAAAVPLRPKSRDEEVGAGGASGGTSSG